MDAVWERSGGGAGDRAGDVGALARNVIPTTATAVLDLRLVKGNDHQRQTQRLIEHIRKLGYHVTDREPTDTERMQYPLLARVNIRAGGYNAERTRALAMFSPGGVLSFLESPLRDHMIYDNGSPAVWPFGLRMDGSRVLRPRSAPPRSRRG